jgi:hypothetical protein
MSLPLILILGALAFFAMSGSASAATSGVMAVIPSSARKVAADAIRAMSGGFSMFFWKDRNGQSVSGSGEDFAKAIEAGNAFSDPATLSAENLKAQADLIRARKNTRYMVSLKNRASPQEVNETDLASLIERGPNGPISMQIPCFWEVAKIA